MTKIQDLLSLLPPLNELEMNKYVSLGTVLILCVVILATYRAFLHPLSGIPGPLAARLTGLWRTYEYAKGTWHDKILQLHNEYGPVVRIAPNEISIVDEKVMKQLYGHGHNELKTTWYNIWIIKGLPTGFFAEQNKTIHSGLRKKVSTAYSMTAILRFEKYIQQCLDLMMQRLRVHAEGKRTVNMSEWTNALAFDVVGELAFGEPFGHLEAEEDVLGIRNLIYNGFWLSSILGHVWGQLNLIQNPVVESILALVGQKSPFGALMDWTNEKVMARRASGEKVQRHDMLSHFLAMKNADGTPVSHSDVLIESLNIVGAGADTTSIGMRTCLYYICSSPEVYKKLQKEIDDYYEAKGLSEPISYLQTQELPYLKAVVKEATRLLPSIVYQLLRYAPPGGLHVRGHSIPEGTPVGISPISQNRDPQIWGGDANEFIPERWLGDPAHARRLEASLMTFGGNGPRMCIGKNIAMVELQKFLAQLLRNFDVGFVDGRPTWSVKSFWFAQQFDMHMWIRCRQNPVIA